jgi:hypothetical protein
VFNTGRRTGLVLVLVGSFLCVVNGMLILQNRNLKSALKVKDRDKLVKIGQKVPPLRGRTAHGDQVTELRR